MSNTLHSLLVDLSQRFPDRPALTLLDRTVTFSELAAAAAQVARRLIAGGIMPGDRIAVVDKNSIDYYELIFGASFAGAVLVGLNYRLSAREICTVVTDANPKILFLSPELDQLCNQLDVESNAEMRIVALGADFELWRDAAPASADFPDMASDDIVLQMYSSGTTGVPKGAMLTHGNLLFTPTMGREFYGMTKDSVNLLTSPLFHIGGTGYSLTTFGQGGHTVLVRDFVVANVLASIEAHRVTNMFLVPAMIDMLTNESLKSSHDFSSLALIAYGGAPITDPQLLSAVSILGCGFMAVYGMTESAGTIAYLGVEDHDPNGPRQHLLGSIGRSLPWNEIIIVDPVTGRECAEGVVGELLVRGGQTMAGYWNQPAATRQAVDSAGWLHTGDNALKDADGFIFLKDRLKDMIISGGENIYPIEVENVLMEHPSIAEVAVIGVPHARWGETTKAVIALIPDALLEANDATAEEIIDFCRARLARYKCPSSIDFVAALPRNASGKVLKRELREPYLASAKHQGATA